MQGEGCRRPRRFCAGKGAIHAWPSEKSIIRRSPGVGEQRFFKKRGVSGQTLLRKTIFGPNSSGVYLKEGAVQIVAWGDFSEATARAFIDTSKSFFPDIAVAVFRDITPDSKDWPLIARYDPGKAGQPVR